MSIAQAVIKESITSVGPSGNTDAGISLTSSGGDFYIAKMQNGLEYKIAQEAWSIKTDYYLDTFVHHLSGIIANLQENGNPVKRVLEIGVARGVLSIGIALLTGEETRIVGIDIEEKAHALVTKNARANGVEHKIEVRIGDMFSPVQAGESFDLIIAELPIIPVDPEKQQRYIVEGYASEILNISGGANGRDFVDALMVQGAPFLNPGGAIVLIQPSFLGTEVTIQRYAAVGLKGEVLVNKPWRLRDTKFTLNNKDYIAATTGYVYPTNSEGDEIFYLTILKGVK